MRATQDLRLMIAWSALQKLKYIVHIQCRGMASYRHTEQETGSSTPQVVERHSWYHPEGQGYKWKSTGKNRTNTSWEGEPRKKDAIAWSCRENGWSTHSEASYALGSCGIQEKTWQAKDELERYGKEGPPKNGMNLGRGWSISSRQTFVASTCGLCIGDAGWIDQEVYIYMQLTYFRQYETSLQMWVTVE